MPNLKLILNPVADNGHAAEMNEVLHTRVEEHARAAAGSGLDYQLTWIQTEYPRHATELARTAAEEGFDMVVAIGGDGTVHEIVNGLMTIAADRRPKLGVLPIGSGNDFAHNVGVAIDVEQAVANLFGGAVRRIDVGVIRDASGRSEYWDNTIGIGFSGVVNLITRSITRIRGFLMYFTAVVRTILFHPQRLHATIQIDTNQPFERHVSMLSVCNGPREGGGFPVVPDAKMDDGLLSFAVLRQSSRLQMFYLLPIVMNARHTGLSQFFIFGTAKYLRFETREPLTIHVDGEVFATEANDVRMVEFEAMPAALEVICCK